MTEIILNEPADALEGLVLDALDLNDQGTYSLEGFEFTPAKKRGEEIVSPDADGGQFLEDRYINAFMRLKVRIVPQATQDGALAALGALTDKLQATSRVYGGSPVEWTPSGGTTLWTWYAIRGEYEEIPITMQGDDAGWTFATPVVRILLTLRPFGYNDEGEQSVPAVNGTDPVLELEVPDVEGDVDAEARLVVTDLETQDYQDVSWGRETSFYDPSDPQPVLIDSDAMTLVGGTGGTQAGAYDVGGGNTVIQATLVTEPITICEFSSAHIGVFNVKLRAYSDSADVYYRLAYRVGDGEWVRNAFALAIEDDWAELALGTAHLRQIPEGTHSWEGRIEAYSDTIGSVGKVDYALVMPAEGAGSARAPRADSTPNAVAAADLFDDPAYTGALTGEVAPLGGTWSGAGDADDFTQDTTNLWTQRTANSDADVNTGRYARLGTATPAAVVVQADVKATLALVAGERRLGVFTRYVDTSNWLMAVLRVAPSLRELALYKRVAGTTTLLGSVEIASGSGSGTFDWRTIKLTVDATGNVAVYEGAQGGALTKRLEIAGDANLATGGTLDDGGVGIYDVNTSTTGTNTRLVDNFIALSGSEVQRYALHAGRSIEFRHDSTIRESADGTSWGKPPLDRSRFWLPPGTSRVVVRARRNDVTGGQPDDVIDDEIEAQAFWTPRYLAPR